MSRTTVLRRLAASAAAATGLVLATLTLASPAYAADSVEVDFSGVSGSITAGSRTFDSVSGTFVNRTNNSITNIQPVFTIHLDGMPSDGVRILRTLGAELAVQPAGDGTVRITDPSTFELLRNGRRTVTYQLQFTASAPSGKASITFEAYSGGTRLGGDSASTTVKGSAVPQTTTTAKTSAPNTDPGLVPTFTGGPSYSLAAPPGQTGNQTLAADVPVGLYVMGALLVGIGGVILFLLFRRQQPLATVASYPTEYEPVRPPTLGYPSRSGPLNPTTVLPTVRDAEPPTRSGPDRPR